MIKENPSFFKSNTVTWIRPLGALYNHNENIFENVNKSEDMPLQSPYSLGKSKFKRLLHQHLIKINKD